MPKEKEKEKLLMTKILKKCTTTNCNLFFFRKMKFPNILTRSR